MAMYALSRSNVALNTANDTITIIAGASRRLRVIEVLVGGMGTASAANEVTVSRSTGGTTGGGALTPQKLQTDAPTQTFTNFTTWSAQPSLSGDPVVRIPVNANGGVVRWLARADQMVEARNSEQISIRAAVGSSNVSLTVIVDEL
jgi:hypothetical protein